MWHLIAARATLGKNIPVFPPRKATFHGEEYVHAEIRPTQRYVILVTSKDLFWKTGFYGGVGQI